MLFNHFNLGLLQTQSQLDVVNIFTNMHIYINIQKHIYMYQHRLNLETYIRVFISLVIKPFTF